jgi:uncharacterized membrane protein YdjX (TVP38/TMEM64 family)
VKERIGRESSSAFLKLWKCILLLIWLGIILIFFFCQDEISVDAILRFTPVDPLLAAIVMLALFAVKSLSVVIYIGILFAACGIMFTLPVAILINIFGTVIMVSIPYVIGKKIGAEAVERIMERYPKAKALRKLRFGNAFFFSFIVRIIGILPGDIVSLYMGAVSMSYPKYLAGSLLGFLPKLIAITVIGMSITDIRSPQFIAAICMDVLIIILSFIFFMIYKKKHKYSE